MRISDWSSDVCSSDLRLQTSTTRMKGLFLVGAPFWLAQNLMVGALFALGTDLVSLASNLANLMKFLVRRRVSAPASTSIASITEPATILARSDYLTTITVSAPDLNRTNVVSGKMW